MNTHTSAQCQWLCEVTGQPVLLATCLECARHRQQPACPFPPTILRALAHSLAGEAELVELRALAAEAKVALLRVTSLLGCTRQAWYALHSPAPLEKPNRHWARLRGTIFHAAAAKSRAVCGRIARGRGRGRRSAAGGPARSGRCAGLGIGAD